MRAGQSSHEKHLDWVAPSEITSRFLTPPSCESHSPTGTRCKHRCLLRRRARAADFAPHVPTPVHQERGNLILEGIPAPDAALAERLERYLHARDASFLDWLTDGGMLISTRFGDVDEIHRLASPLGMREQLTFYADPVNAARSPQNLGAEGFAFLKDLGGDENAQLYYYAWQTAARGS